MLVLTRKPGESISIGTAIVVKAIDCEKGSVKLAIEAPKHITILRSELKKYDFEEKKNVFSSSHPTKKRSRLFRNG